MGRILLILFIIISINGITDAQMFKYPASRVLQYTDENGLPQNSAKELVFDESGFLWVATESGMVIYDGVHFIPVNGIKPTTKIDYSLQDFNGNIYFCDASSNIYKKTKGSQSLSQINNYGSSSHEFLFPSICHDKHALDSAIFKFYFLSHYMGQDNKVTLDGKNDVTFVQNELDFEEKRYSYFVFKDYIFRLYKNKDIYARHKNDKEWKYITQSGVNLEINFGDKSIYTGLIFTGGDHMFISDNQKIYRISFDGKNLHSEIYINYVPINHIEDKIFVADYDSIHDVFAFGSQNKGLFIVTGTNFVTTNIENSNSDKFDEYNNVFYSQAVLPNNEIVTGTGYKQDRSKSQNLFRIGPTYHYNRALVFADKNIYASIIDKRTISIRENDTNKSYNYSLPEQYNSFRCFAGTKDDGYYFAIETDLYQFDKNKTFKKISVNSEFQNNYIRQLYDQSDQYLWIVSERCILQYDKHKNTFDTISQSKNLDIQHVFKLSENMYLAGTYGNGFFAYYEGQMRTMPLDKKSYLKFTHTFIKDDQGFIWIPTNKGLFQVAAQDMIDYIHYKTSNIYYHYYDKSFGFETNEFNGRCLNPGVLTYDGMLSFSSMNGLVQFYPNNVKARTPNAPIQIVSIWVDTMIVENIEDQVILEPDFKKLRLRIRSPYYGHPDNLSLEYRLLGHQDSWQEINAAHEIEIENIKYGKYTLEIRKKTGFGLNNTSYKNLEIMVRPYFYQTWWFYVSMLLILMGWMYLFSLWYNRVILRQKSALSNMVQDRTYELNQTNVTLKATNEQNNLLLSVLIHDIKAPMKIVQNVTEDIKSIWNKISDPEKLEMIADVSVTTRKINQFMFQFINYIKSQNNENLLYEDCIIYELVDEIITFHDQDEKIKSQSIQVLNNVPETLVFLCEKQLVKIVMNNLLDNSIKFSKSGKIIFDAYQDEKWTYIRCTDSGKGMTKENIQQILSDGYKANNIRKDSYRLGYAFINNIVKKLKGEIDIKSKINIGTTVIIRLPN
ncbi:MAG TPA: ATP-binding protein [Saprospiraceae bacterium]|nr:ATP-binding protein [Saprospiraceae bacterium]